MRKLTNKKNEMAPYVFFFLISFAMFLWLLTRHFTYFHQSKGYHKECQTPVVVPPGSAIDAYPCVEQSTYLQFNWDSGGRGSATKYVVINPESNNSYQASIDYNVNLPQSGNGTAQFWRGKLVLVRIGGRSIWVGDNPDDGLADTPIIEILATGFLSLIFGVLIYRSFVSIRTRLK